MKTMTFDFDATGSKRLPRGMAIYGINMVPADSTFAAAADGYACARIIDKSEGAMGIDDDPAIFCSVLAVKANVMSIISNPPMISKWTRLSTPFLSVVISVIAVKVTIYFEEANFRQ